MVNKPLITCKGSLPVKNSPPGHMAAALEHLPLPFPPDTELFLLHTQAVLSQQIPEGRLFLYGFRQIRHIAFCARAYQPLDPHQRPFRPLKTSHHGQRMGKLRTENMHQIRFEICKNSCKPLFHRQII